MAAKRGKSQAKRNGGGNNPAWLWVGVGLDVGPLVGSGSAVGWPPPPPPPPPPVGFPLGGSVPLG